MQYNSRVNNVIVKIEDHLDQISILSKGIDKLIRTDELGQQLDFSTGEEVFKKTFEVITPLKGADLSNIPYEILEKFEIELSSVRNDFGQILSFSPKKSTQPENIRNQLIANVDRRQTSLFNATYPILTFLMYYGKGFGKTSQDIRSSLKEVEATKKHISEKSEKMLAEIDSILAISQKTAGALGVTEYSKIFQEESDEHQRTARSWLKATIGLMVLLVVVGFVPIIFSDFIDTNNNYSLIQLAVTKILVLTVLFYGLNLCAKNYRSHTHNSILNKHRQNALRTFETFVKASGEDNQTKNAVLLEATRTIFTNQQTGYINGENEAEFPSRIIEIIKSSKE